ncbi:MAG TPA: phosphate-starvation-inducible PsiE family protein, partial [Methanocellaceae archaeon]
LLVSIFLIIMALIAMIIVGRDIFTFITGSLLLGDLVTALQDLLTVLIIAELIQTVVVYFQSHQLDLKLILAAGMTAMIRRILVFGAEKGVDTTEMVVIAALIAIIAIAIVVIGRDTRTHEGS